MKKTFTIVITLLAVILLSVPTMAASVEQTNIQAIQGIVTQSTSPAIISIDTIDGNGWYLETSEEQQPDSLFVIDDTLNVGDTVVIVYDNKGTSDIYDDELISIVKVI